MQPAARVGDMHGCPMVTPATPPVPHVGGPILPPGGVTVVVGGPPAARMGDMCTCIGPPDVIVRGEPTVLIMGQPAARVGDNTAHGGVVVVGLPTVLIGMKVPSAAPPGSPPAPPGGVYIGQYGGLPAYEMPDGTIQVGESIVIQGDDTFQANVLGDLQMIGATPNGAGLMQSIDESGRTMTIRPLDPGDSGNATGYTTPADRFSNADGTPGPGTDSTVYYDPDTETISDNPWGTRPPAIGLAHEMIHGDQAMHGTQTDGTTNNDNRPDPADPTQIHQTRTREVEAAGIPPNDDREFNENQIRSEWDPPQSQREWY